MAMKLGDAYVLLGLKKDGLKKGLDSAKKETQKAAGGMGSLFKTVLGAAVVGAVVMGVKKIVGGIKDMIVEAAGVEKVAQTFDKLTASVGGNAVQALDQLREATRGMVSDADAMAAGNKFLAMGLANTTEEAAKLAEMGSQLGMAMGGEATEGMEAFALMLANQSLPRMDTFGMSSGKARVRINQLMQETKGMTREQAFMTAVMEQGSATMAKVGEQSGGAAGAMGRLRAVMTNLKNNVGKGFLSVFSNVLNTISGLGQRMAPVIERVAAGLGAIGQGAFNVLKTMVKTVATALGIDFDQMSKDAVSWGENIVLQLAKGIAGAIRAVLGALRTLGNAIRSMLQIRSPPRLLPDLTRWGAGAAAAYMEGWGEADVSVFSKLTRTIGGYLRALPEKVMAKERVNPWLASLNAAIADTISGVDQLGGVNRDLFDDLLASAKFLPESMRTYARSLLDVEIAQADVGRAMERLERATEDVAAAQAELNGVTEHYDGLLAPLNAKMEELQDKRQAIRDEQRLGELREKLTDAEATETDKALARLEMEEIALRQQMDSVEDERDLAVDAAEEKLNAAELAQQAAQKGVDLAEAAVQAAQKQVAIQERLIGIQSEANQMLSQQASIMESLAAAAAGVGAGISGITASISGAVKGMTSDVLTDIEKLTADITAEFEMGEEIETAISPWKDIFADETTTGREKVKAILTEMGEETKELVAGWLTSLAEETFAMGWAAIQTRFNTWKTEEFIPGWHDFWDNVRIIGGFELDQLWIDTAAGWLKIKNTVAQKWLEMKTSIAEELEAIKKNMKERWEEVKSHLESIDLKQIGKDILQGLWNGLKSKWGGIASWLSEKAAWVLSKWRIITGTHSPSTKFRDLGQNLMEGLQQGLELGYQGVERTTERQAGEMVGAPAGGGLAQALAAPPAMGAGAGAGDVVRLLGAILASLERGAGTLEINLVDQGERRGRVSTRMARTGKQSVNLALDMAVAGF